MHKMLKSVFGENKKKIQNTVDPCYLEFQGTH